MNEVDYSQYDGLGAGEFAKEGDGFPNGLAQLRIRGGNMLKLRLNEGLLDHKEQIEHHGITNETNGRITGVPCLRKELSFSYSTDIVPNGATRKSWDHQMSTGGIRGGSATTNAAVTVSFVIRFPPDWGECKS